MNGTRRPWWVLLLPLAIGLALAAGLFLGLHLARDQKGPTFFQLRSAGPGEKLEQVMRLIDRNYVDTVNADGLVDEVLQDMLQKLDPHSYYISAAELRAAQEPLEGSFMGIGVEFAIQRDTIVVISPVEGGPSAKLGIRAGDRIISADGKPLAAVQVTNQDVMKALRGPEGTKVTVAVVRGRAKPFEVVIERGEIPINSVAVAFVDQDGTGYVRLSRFARTTEEEFVKATERLKEQGMQRLVMDLRGNGGGYLNAAIGLCDRLLPEGRRIVYTEGRSSPRKEFFASGNGDLTGLPLAVLIDEGSASASEIVAGAIQDNDRGVVVGRRSFGKGLVQEHIELEDHSAVRITTARYYTPSGRSIQRPYGEGINYDQELTDRFDHGELLNQDSISVDSSKSFTTLGGRTVYGGGGIVPDRFVPADTTDRSPYLTELLFSGAINQVAFDMADKQRPELERYGSAKAFAEKFVVSEQLMAQLTREAGALGVKENPAGLTRSKRLIAERLKAGIARNIWGEEGYYRVVLGSDPIYRAAREGATVAGGR